MVHQGFGNECEGKGRSCLRLARTSSNTTELRKTAVQGRLTTLKPRAGSLTRAGVLPTHTETAGASLQRSPKEAEIHQNQAPSQLSCRINEPGFGREEVARAPNADVGLSNAATREASGALLCYTIRLAVICTVPFTPSRGVKVQLESACPPGISHV